MRLAAVGVALLGVAVAGKGAEAPLSPRDVAVMPSELARLASRSLLLDLAVAGNRLVAVGSRGQILLSDDAGQTWTQTETPTQNLLTGVCFGDARHGIVVGHDEIALASGDGGRTWKRTHFAPQAQQPLLDVWCGSQGRAIAVGAYGVYLVSTDYGASWEERKLDVTNPPPAPAGAAKGANAGDPGDEIVGGYHLNAIAADASSRLYVAAEAGHLYRSDDRGNTWKSLPFPYQGSLFGVLPLNGDTVLAFGLRGNLFRSADAGATWQRITTGTEATLDGATTFADGRVAVVGLSGVVLLSHDGASSFSLLQQDDRKGLAAVREAQSGTLLTVGESGIKLIPEPHP
jgi:photosystem II stability/assembly factor-like uncharacterized protein